MQKKYIKVKHSKIFNRLAVKLATLFGIGNVQHCPGTVGSLVGTVIYAIMIRKVAILPRSLIMLFMLILSLVVCDVTEKALKKHDPKEVILDEFVAMPFVFFSVEEYFPKKLNVAFIMIIGFIIFRIFDILKPIGINRLQKLPGGIGIVADDIAAAICSNITLKALGVCLSCI